MFEWKVLCGVKVVVPLLFSSIDKMKININGAWSFSSCLPLCNRKHSAVKLRWNRNLDSNIYQKHLARKTKMLLKSTQSYQTDNQCSIMPISIWRRVSSAICFILTQTKRKATETSVSLYDSETINQTIWTDRRHHIRRVTHNTSWLLHLTLMQQPRPPYSAIVCISFGIITRPIDITCCFKCMIRHLNLIAKSDFDSCRKKVLQSMSVAREWTTLPWYLLCEWVPHWDKMCEIALSAIFLCLHIVE